MPNITPAATDEEIADLRNLKVITVDGVSTVHVPLTFMCRIAARIEQQREEIKNLQLQNESFYRLVANNPAPPGGKE